MRYNPYGKALLTEKNTEVSKLSMMKKYGETDPVRVVVIVMAVLSTNCILVLIQPHTTICACLICMLSEYPIVNVGEVSGLTALPEVTGIVTSSLFRVIGENEV